MSDSMIKIAIADDARLMCSIFASHFNELKNRKVILESYSGPELIAGLQLLKHLPDICIIETNNRILNNYTTLLELKEMFPMVKVLALSSFKLEYTIIKMIQHGIRGYLFKECSVDELNSAIEQLSSNDYYYSDIAPNHLFAIAKTEVLLTLTKRELQLLSSGAKKIKHERKITVSCLEENMAGDAYYVIMKKLRVRDHIGLATFMMQAGLLPGRHIL